MSAPARIEELKKRYDENPHRFFAPLANEYRKSGDLEQAIFICETHLSEKQGTLNGHVVYGQALFDAGRLDESKRTFETALTFDPENLISLRHLGDIARTQGDPNGARQWYTRVLDADPRNHEIIAFLAELPAAPRKTPPGTTPVGATQRVQTPPDSTPTAPMPVTSLRVATQVAPPQRAPTPAATAAAAASPRVATPGSATPVHVTPAAPPAVITLPPIDVAAELLDLTIDLGPETPAPPPDSATNFRDVEIVLTLPSAAPTVTPAPPRAPDSTPAFAPQSTSAFAPEVTPTSTPAAAPARSSGSTEAPVEMLFGDIPFFPENEAHQTTSNVDSFMGRTPSFGVDAVPKASETRMPFVTETMAELYLQQGFREEGIAVYRQLLEQNPGDTTLQKRVAALSAGSRSSLELDWEFDASDAAAAPEAEEVADVTEPRAAFAAQEPPTASAAPEEPPAAWSAPTPQAAQAAVTPRETRAVSTPHAQRAVEFTPPSMATVAAAAAATPPASPLAVVSPTPPFSSPQPRTARELFGALAARRAVKRDPTSPTGIATAPAAPAREHSPPGTIDTMFDEARASAEDERVASSLANAAAGFGAGPDIKGRPTQPAATELSLDTVFRATPMRGTAAAPAEASSLSFDQFFAQPASGDASQSASAPAQSGPPDAVAPGEEGQEPPRTDARSTAELEQFQDWLQQLKKP